MHRNILFTYWIFQPSNHKQHEEMWVSFQTEKYCKELTDNS